jgi:adenylate cyclase
MQEAIPSIGDHPTARRLPRRDLTIAFVDVVGFSALMAGDEDGTFDRWRAIREEVVLPLLSEHGGRLVAFTGDGIFATFDAALSALRWSEAVQRRARGARAGLAMRIGLNHCRVLLDGGDPVGHGVNVAARLQERAVPGGVIFTRAVYDATCADPSITCRRLGPMVLKNIAAPVEAYELVTDGRALATRRREEPDRPSLAVLPLRRVGGCAADDYFAEGLLEDVTTALASLRDLLVISRQSTLAVADQDIAAVDVGRALGVRYVLGGTLQRSGGRLRAGVTLTDATEGGTLSHERAEFAEDELFAVQDALVEHIVARIAPQIRATELRRVRRKRPESFTAYDLYLRGLDGITRTERAAFDEGYRCLEQAMARDPNFPMPFAWAARCHSIRVGQGWSEDVRADQQRAAELAGQAIALDRRNALALATYGHIRSYLFADYDTATDYLRRARAACPSCPVAWMLSSATSSYLDDPETAVAQGERALRLSPFDPHLFMIFHVLGIAHYVAGAFEEALRWCRRAHAEHPTYTSNLKLLTAIFTALERPADAAAAVERLRELEPSFRLRAYDRTGRPFRCDRKSAAFAALLRAAGLPD